MSTTRKNNLPEKSFLISIMKLVFGDKGRLSIPEAINILRNDLNFEIVGNKVRIPDNPEVIEKLKELGFSTDFQVFKPINDIVKVNIFWIDPKSTSMNYSKQKAIKLLVDNGFEVDHFANVTYYDDDKTRSRLSDLGFQPIIDNSSHKVSDFNFLLEPEARLHNYEIIFGEVFLTNLRFKALEYRYPYTYILHHSFDDWKLGIETGYMAAGNFLLAADLLLDDNQCYDAWYATEELMEESGEDVSKDYMIAAFMQKRFNDFILGRDIGCPELESIFSYLRDMIKIILKNSFEASNAQDLISFYYLNKKFSRSRPFRPVYRSDEKSELLRKYILNSFSEEEKSLLKKKDLYSLFCDLEYDYQQKVLEHRNIAKNPKEFVRQCLLAKHKKRKIYKSRWGIQKEYVLTDEDKEVLKSCNLYSLWEKLDYESKVFIRRYELTGKISKE